MEVMGILQSWKQARRLIDEIAVAGGWKAAGNIDTGVFYRKGEEELVIVKKAKRQWEIVKRRREASKVGP